jgi:mono/diheme cytochrome c family protein
MKKRKKQKQPPQQPRPASQAPLEVRTESESPTPINPSASRVSATAVKEIGGEPMAARASVPPILFALLAALLFWGDLYVVEHGGELDARVYQPYQNFKQIEDLQPKGEEQIVMAKGQQVFVNCAACHQNDGNGSTSQNAPPLAGSEWVLANDPARIIRIVLHGLSGPISVKGKEWGAGTMPPWALNFSDEQIAHVLTYARNSWGNKAPTVTVDQVKKVRAETKDRQGPMNQEELLKVPAK